MNNSDYTITVVFGDETTIRRKVGDYPGDNDGFIGFFCGSFEIPKDSLSIDDTKSIIAGLNTLRNTNNVVIQLKYSKKQDVAESNSLIEFFARHIQNGKITNFWIHYSTWRDFWAKVRTIFFKEPPPRQFSKLVVCDKARLVTYDLLKGNNSTGAISDNPDWQGVIRNISQAENTVYILEDFDLVLETDDNYRGDEHGIKSQLKNLLEGDQLQKNNSYIIVAANASDEIRIPSQLRGLWERYKDSSKDFPELEGLGENLTQKAKAKKIEPIYGRDSEIDDIIKKLSMSKYNNVLILGSPGIGKTAIIKGLALKIAAGDVPEKLKNVEIFDVPFSNIMKDTSIAGSLETKIANLRDEVKSHKKEVIICFDEFHQLMSNDTIRNVLKPALANGEFPCIGATTDGEYQQFVANVDPAFEQRFLKIHLDELPKDIIKNIFLSLIKNSQKNISVSDSDLEYLYWCCKKLEPLLQLPRSGEKILTNLIEEKEENGTIDKNSIKKHFAVGNLSIRLNSINEYGNILSGISNVIKGQDNQVAKILTAIKNHYFLLTKVEKPLVMLFMGPTGTGKTELARNLAIKLWGDENRFLLFNMGSVDFKTSITGAPPGYVGHDQGSPILDFMRSKDSGIVVLDEFEKVFLNREAGSDKLSVLDTFLEMFDKGATTDNRGRRINCRPFIFVLTSNLANDADPNIDNKQKARILIDSGLKKEFVGRIDLIEIFSKISADKAIEIIKEQLAEYNELSDFNCKFELDNSVTEYLLDKSNFDEFGARNLIYTVQSEMKQVLSNNLDKINTDTVYILKYENNSISLIAKS